MEMRTPAELPSFFIKFLTQPGDTVLDIVGGSNTTGFAAEGLDRKWLAFELSQEYLRSSIFRFMGKASHGEIKRVLDALKNPEANLHLDNIDVAPPTPTAETPTPKRRKEAQGVLFG